MKIESIISEGEKISDSQMIDLCGGSALMANANNAMACKCQGNGTNTNTSWFCSCSEQISERRDPNDPEKTTGN
ncbi:MAG: hypothetical protein SOW44_01150 [Porphyromonas sp.]|nr:hypothetical protein [Bacteroidales bacterium]MDY3099941.1 hypothetical protein [Porphyromonas sp.]